MKKSTSGKIRVAPESLSDMLLKCLVRTTLELWGAVNCGHTVPYMLALREEMANPQPGDTVMEISSTPRYLAQGVKIPRHVIGQLAYGAGDIWVINALSGKQVTWRNCKFIKMIDRAPDCSLGE